MNQAGRENSLPVFLMIRLYRVKGREWIEGIEGRTEERKETTQN
jgi:hypothetical protein